MIDRRKGRRSNKSKVAHNGASTFDLFELGAALRPVRALAAPVRLPRAHAAAHSRCRSRCRLLTWHGAARAGRCRRAAHRCGAQAARQSARVRRVRRALCAGAGCAAACGWLHGQARQGHQKLEVRRPRVVLLDSFVSSFLFFFFLFFFLFFFFFFPFFFPFFFFSSNVRDLGVVVRWAGAQTPLFRAGGQAPVVPRECRGSGQRPGAGPDSPRRRGDGRRGDGRAHQEERGEARRVARRLCVVFAHGHAHLDLCVRVRHAARRAALARRATHAHRRAGAATRPSASAGSPMCARPCAGRLRASVPAAVRWPPCRRPRSTARARRSAVCSGAARLCLSAFARVLLQVSLFLCICVYASSSLSLYICAYASSSPSLCTCACFSPRLVVSVRLLTLLCSPVATRALRSLLCWRAATVCCTFRARSTTSTARACCRSVCCTCTAPSCAASAVACGKCKRLTMPVRLRCTRGVCNKLMQPPPSRPQKHINLRLFPTAPARSKTCLMRG